MSISNKTLAVLLVFSMIVSLSGTLIFLSKGPVVTTGYAGSGLTTTGTVDYNISATSAIEFVNDALDFGEGAVNATNPTASTCTIKTGTSAGADCTGFSEIPTNGFLLQNIGNANVSVAIKSDISNATFLNDESSFNFQGYEGERGATADPCASGLAESTGMTTSDQNVCTSLNWVNGDDILGIDIELVISENVTGSNQATITATATLA